MVRLGCSTVADSEDHFRWRHYARSSTAFPFNSHSTLLLLFEQPSLKAKYSIIKSVLRWMFLCHLYRKFERFKQPPRAAVILESGRTAAEKKASYELSLAIIVYCCLKCILLELKVLYFWAYQVVRTARPYWTELFISVILFVIGITDGSIKQI